MMFVINLVLLLFHLLASCSDYVILINFDYIDIFNTISFEDIIQINYINVEPVLTETEPPYPDLNPNPPMSLEWDDVYDEEEEEERPGVAEAPEEI